MPATSRWQALIIAAALAASPACEGYGDDDGQVPADDAAEDTDEDTGGY